LFGAACPQRRVAAGLVMPAANAETMSLHLTAIGRKVAAGSHAALVLDGAGYHIAAALTIPENVTLVRLPPYAPELNPIENVWEYLRGNKLAITIFDDYDDIVDKTCDPEHGRLSIIRAVGIRSRDPAPTVEDGRDSGLVLLQDPNNLLFTETAALHPPVLSFGPELPSNRISLGATSSLLQLLKNDLGHSEKTLLVPVNAKVHALILHCMELDVEGPRNPGKIGQRNLPLS
jgi:DDE superfamily endonuclease